MSRERDGPINRLFHLLGKSDKELVYLYVWLDNDCPDFCALCAVLVYVFLSGVKEGFLFMTDDELMAMPTNRVTTTRISYSLIKTRLQFLFNTILKNKDKFLGCHT
jgi:hypothetical protein